MDHIGIECYINKVNTLAAFSVAKPVIIIVTILVTFCVTSVSFIASALEISPLTIELKTDAKPSYQQILVRNTSNTRVPVEISINELIFNSQNSKPLFSLIPVENDSDLLVFPPAVILEAGEAKAIRVQWNGDKKIPLSKSYFIRFSQPQIKQPLKSFSDESGVKIFVHFNAVVHVSSVELTANLSISPNTLTTNKQQNTINVDVKNNGNSYHYLTPDQIVKINESKNILSKLPDSTYNSMSDTFFPPHSIRKITIPMGSDWHEGDSFIINAEKK